MSVIKFLSDVTGLFNWSTDENPTTQLDYQNAVKNWQETEKNLVNCTLWQPETEYAVGDQVRTPTLPLGYVLVCTEAGTSGAMEQTYTGVVVGSTVTDGTVEWKVNRNECIHSSGTNYIRYVSGLQICWGSKTGVTSSGTTIDFDAAFNATPRVTLSVGANANVWWSNVNTTSVTVKTSSSGGAIVYYIAIGYWK